MTSQFKIIKVERKYYPSKTQLLESGANLFIGDNLNMDVFCGRKKKAK